MSPRLPTLRVIAMLRSEGRLKQDQPQGVLGVQMPWDLT